jgi:hypothetical protein
MDGHELVASPPVRSGLVTSTFRYGHKHATSIHLTGVPKEVARVDKRDGSVLGVFGDLFPLPVGD